MLWSIQHLQGLSLDFPVALPFTEEPRTGHSIPAVASSVQMRAKGSPPSTLGSTDPNTAQDTTVLPCHKGTALSHIQLGVPPRPEGFFCVAAFPIIAPII